MFALIFKMPEKFAGAKLETHHENPLDVLCVRFSEAVSPTMRGWGFTPNMVTTLSIFCSAMAIRSVYLGNRKLQFVGWALLSYLFDCVDGHMARTYDMCTKFGDFYDHISDWGYFIALFYVAFIVRGFKPFAEPYRMAIFGIIALATFGMMVHMGLQEWIYREKTGEHSQGPTLNYFSKIARGICNGHVHECIQGSKFLGTGTFVMIVILVVVFFIK